MNNHNLENLMSKVNWVVIIVVLSAYTYSCDHFIPQKKKQRNAPQSQIFSALSPSYTNIGIQTKQRATKEKFYGSYVTGASAAGDLNNDGMMDIVLAKEDYLKIYLNQGNFQFQDITDSTKINLNKNFDDIEGVLLADINGNGFQDIYVLLKGMKWKQDSSKLSDYGRNKLYINGKDLTFTETSNTFNVDVPGHPQDATFFDYDNDGDLDLYIVQWPHNFEEGDLHSRAFDFSFYNSKPPNSVSYDLLYENIQGKYFKEVTNEANLLKKNSFGNSVCVSDINNDDWLDIYVGNDFFGQDYLYINNQDKTFSEKSDKYFGPTSLSSMGSDFADINNDGLPDLIVGEMLPQNKFRQNMNVLPYSIEMFQNFETFNLPQYQRNVLQLNQNGQRFDEIGFLAGVHATEWTWSNFFADFNNDGHKDLFFTNGFEREITNIDFIKESYGPKIFKSSNKFKTVHPKHANKDISKIPMYKNKNFVYKNLGDLRFQQVNKKWGLTQKLHGLSGSYADFDNDGDVDLLVHHVDTFSTIYRNLTSEKSANNYLRVNLEANEINSNAVGSKVHLFAQDMYQMVEIITHRGFRGTVPPIAHFGLDTINHIDSLKIEWLGGGTQTITDIQPNKQITVEKQDTSGQFHKANSQPLYEKVDKYSNLNFTHQEQSFNDFKRDKLLHRKLSREGPPIAVADVNGNGREDFYIGGAAGSTGRLYLQQKDGSFIQSKQQPFYKDNGYEDMDALFFDANGDNAPDLYIASGSNEFSPDDPYQQDRLFINNGDGKFQRGASALPNMITSTGCVAAGDYDGDGDQDLFVGGRLIPGRYPKAPRSYILENDNGMFRDVTDKVAPSLTKPGLVSSALWSDYNNDNRLDLVITGEWMPIMVWQNEGEQFTNVTKEVGLDTTHGWWNTIEAGDFNRDGKTDYIAGNHGLNSYFKASKKEPVFLYAGDFDSTGKIKPVLFHYVQGEISPYPHRDLFCSTMPKYFNKFITYEDYAKASLNDIIPPTQQKKAIHLEAYQFASCLLKNQGENGFTIEELPVQAQLAPVYSFAFQDFNRDDQTDLIVGGNSYSNHYELGNMEALGVMPLVGKADGSFTSTDKFKPTGFEQINGDVKEVQSIQTSPDNDKILLVTQSNGPLKIFRSISLTEKLNQ